MKISIWRQFSSNHSADYTIVGVFDTSEEANKIGQEITDLVVQIREWWRHHKPNPLKELSEPEKQAEKHYGIELE